MLKIIAFLCMSLMVVSCSHKSKRWKSYKDQKKMMWEKLDADKNGEVSKAEFDKAHEDMFTKMDANKDGKVTKEEMKNIFKSDCGSGSGCGDKKDCDGKSGPCKM